MPASWESSTRRDRLPPDWHKRRARVLKRDRHRCQTFDKYTGRYCYQPASQVDHVVPGDNHDESNLAAICDWHHGKKSSAEGNAANRAKRKRIESKFRRTEEHPGLL